MRIAKDMYKIATGGLIALLLTWLFVRSGDLIVPLVIALIVWSGAFVIKGYFVIRDERRSANG